LKRPSPAGSIRRSNPKRYRRDVPPAAETAAAVLRGREEEKRPRRVPHPRRRDPIRDVKSARRARRTGQTAAVAAVPEGEEGSPPHPRSNINGGPDV